MSGANLGNWQETLPAMVRFLWNSGIKTRLKDLTNVSWALGLVRMISVVKSPTPENEFFPFFFTSLNCQNDYIP